MQKNKNQGMKRKLFSFVAALTIMLSASAYSQVGISIDQNNFATCAQDGSFVISPTGLAPGDPYQWDFSSFPATYTGTTSSQTSNTFPNLASGTYVMTLSYVVAGNPFVQQTSASITVARQSYVSVASATGAVDANGDFAFTPSLFLTSTDVCIASTSVSPTTVNCSGGNTYTVTLTITETDGTVYTETPTLTITDGIAPVADNATLTDLTDECAVTAPTAPTATDNCAGTITGTTITSFPITTQGTTVVTWTYDDGNGNTSMQNQNIIINDTTGPVIIDCPVDFLVNADSNGNYTILDYSTILTFNDNCTATGSLTTTQSPISGTVVVEETVNTVTITVSDSVGNDTICTFDITVDPFLEMIIPTFDIVSSICKGDTLAALPTLSINSIAGTWSPAIDKTQTTKYTFTPNTGQFATTTTLTIEVNEIVTPTFDRIAPICEGDTLASLPTLSINSIAGVWSPAIDNTQTTTYTFTPKVGQCSLTTDLTIEVVTLAPTFNTLDASSCSSSDGSITISDLSSNTDYTITYDYRGRIINLNLKSAANGNIVIIGLPSGTYNNFRVTDDATSCEDNLGQFVIGCTQNIVEECFKFKRFFTPNNDGVNDFWYLETINECNYVLYIYDRYGKLLTILDPSNPNWSGTVNGANLPTNDYWFLVKYKTIDGVDKSYRSHFTLKR